MTLSLPERWISAFVTSLGTMFVLPAMREPSSSCGGTGLGVGEVGANGGSGTGFGLGADPGVKSSSGSHFLPVGDVGDVGAGRDGGGAAVGGGTAALDDSPPLPQRMPIHLSAISFGFPATA